jgi:dephospho-CoA kinase
MAERAKHQEKEHNLLNYKDLIDDSLIDQIADLINKQINIPLLSEAAEKHLFKFILILLFQLLDSDSLETVKKKLSAQPVNLVK